MALDPPPARRGFALVAALALLALSAALLVGAATIATALARSARTEHASLAVEAGARHALASVLAAWPDADALAVGQGMERELTALEIGGDGRPAMVGMLRVQRLTTSLYAVVVDVRAGAPVAARHRLRLLVARAAVTDSVHGDSTLSGGASRGAPAPILRWSAADLY